MNSPFSLKKKCVFSLEQLRTFNVLYIIQKNNEWIPRKKCY